MEKIKVIWKIYWPFLLVFIPYLICILINYYIFNDESLTIGQISKNSLNSIWAIFITIIFAMYAVIKSNNSNFRLEIEKINCNSENRIKNLLHGARIVYETQIDGYNKDHVNAVTKCITQLEGATHIYAIDNSNPIHWWNNSMTAYLAILAKWKSEGKSREVSRIFIFNDEDFHNILTAKTIQFHILLGFNTFVYSYESFVEIFNKFKKTLSSKCIIEPKELLIWDGEISKYPNLTLSEPSKTLKNILLYQSFWNIDKYRESMKRVRDNNGIIKNYYGKKLEGSERPKIFFEFLSENIKKRKDNSTGVCYKDLPEQYKALIKYLTLEDNAKPVKDMGDVTDVTLKYFGIKIFNDLPMIETVQDILTRYKRKIGDI